MRVDWISERANGDGGFEVGLVGRSRPVDLPGGSLKRLLPGGATAKDWGINSAKSSFSCEMAS